MINHEQAHDVIKRLNSGNDEDAAQLLYQYVWEQALQPEHETMRAALKKIAETIEAPEGQPYDHLAEDVVAYIKNTQHYAKHLEQYRDLIKQVIAIEQTMSSGVVARDVHQTVIQQRNRWRETATNRHFEIKTLTEELERLKRQLTDEKR